MGSRSAARREMPRSPPPGGQAAGGHARAGPGRVRRRRPAVRRRGAAPHAVIAARESDDEELAAARLVASWPVERAEQVARAFTCYFQLVNLAEERHRARALSERERDATPLAESLAETVARDPRPGTEMTRLRSAALRLRAPPGPDRAPDRVTAACGRRRDDAASATQLEGLEDPRASAREQREAQRRMLEEIDILWRTAQLRSTQLRPLDEVRSAMAVFDETPLRRRCRRSTASSRPRSVARPAPGRRRRHPSSRFGSWVGRRPRRQPVRDGRGDVAGDGDPGRPRAARAGVGGHAASARALTADAVTTPPSSALLGRLDQARRGRPAPPCRRSRRGRRGAASPVLFHVAAADPCHPRRRSDSPTARPVELSTTFGRLRTRSAAGRRRRGSRYGELQELVWQVETFGFHLAELEVRQHSRVHQAALADLGGGGRRPGPDGRGARHLPRDQADPAAIRTRGLPPLRRQLRPATRRTSPNVFRLAEAAVEGRRASLLDVVPLFETVDDLERRHRGARRDAPAPRGARAARTGQQARGDARLLGLDQGGRARLSRACALRRAGGAGERGRLRMACD